MYEFSLSSLFIGLLIMFAGGAVAAFYRPIADNMASGINSYKNTKKFGIITLIIGFLVALSLHTLFLNWLISLFFSRG